MCQVAEGLQQITESLAGFSKEMEHQQSRKQTSQLMQYFLKDSSPEDQEMFQGLDINDPANASLVVTYLNAKRKGDYWDALAGKANAQASNVGKGGSGGAGKPIKIDESFKIMTEKQFADLPEIYRKEIVFGKEVY